MNRIYLINRDKDLAERCAAAFNGPGRVVETFRNRSQALVEFSRRTPDAVILDISDHTLEGNQIMHSVRASSTVPIILLTESSEEIDEIIGLRLGADAVLRKNCSMHLLTAWVETLLKRQQRFGESEKPEKAFEKTLKTDDLVMDPMRMATSWRDHEVSLTLAEFKVLHALASRPGVIKSREALVELIHRDGEYIDERSIDSHVKRIRAKLRDAADDCDCIQTVYGVGYRYAPKPKSKWAGMANPAFKQIGANRVAHVS